MEIKGREIQKRVIPNPLERLSTPKFCSFSEVRTLFLNSTAIDDGYGKRNIVL